MEHRALYQQLVEHLPSERHTIIVGPRQTGKTTIIKQLRNHCSEQGWPVVFLDLEHQDIRDQLDMNPENVFLYAPSTRERVYIFLDEIQKLSDPTHFLKQLYDDYKDSGRIKIVATGSSAFYIDKKFKDSLAGRKRVFHLYTCTFSEYLLLGGKQELTDEYHRLREVKNAKSVMLAQFQKEFYDYMRFGGYPAVVTETSETERIEMLRDLKDSFVKKDIDESGIKDDDTFFRLMQMLAVQTGNLTNSSELAKQLRIKDETVNKYIEVMEKSFHVVRVKPFHRNLGKELVKMPMTYFLDSGMRNVLLNNFQPYMLNPSPGQLWENQVFRLLVDKYGVDDIRFWRTTDKKEVDFVLPNSVPARAFEVKKSQSQATLSKYKTFREAYPDFGFQFLTLEPFSEDVLRFTS